jgi:hypothetical protein
MKITPWLLVAATIIEDSIELTVPYFNPSLVHEFLAVPLGTGLYPC